MNKEIFLKDYDRLKSYKDEQELYIILAEIGDTIEFEGYDIQDIVLLVKEILEINILYLNYTTREQLLSTLCDAVSYYDIRNIVNWERVLNIKNDVEEDLKEYITDFFI